MSENKSEKSRIDFNSETMKQIHQMCCELKKDNPFVKVRSNRLVEYIVSEFYQHYFQNHLSQMQDIFLDRRDLILSKLKEFKEDEQEDELFEAIASLAKKGGSKKNRKKALIEDEGRGSYNRNLVL